MTSRFLCTPRCPPILIESGVWEVIHKANGGEACMWLSDVLEIAATERYIYILDYVVIDTLCLRIWLGNHRNVFDHILLVLCHLLLLLWSGYSLKNAQGFEGSSKNRSPFVEKLGNHHFYHLFQLHIYSACYPEQPLEFALIPGISSLCKLLWSWPWSASPRVGHHSSNTPHLQRYSFHLWPCNSMNICS